MEPTHAAAIEVQPGEVLEPREAVEVEAPEAEPIPVDTTAELLGRAKPKRTGRGVHTRARKSAAPRKPATRRAARAKKPPAEAADSGDKS